MLMQPCHIHTLTLHSPPTHPRSDITADVLTTSRALWGCIEEMSEESMLENFCHEIFRRCIAEKSSILTIPIRFDAEDLTTGQAREEGEILALITLSTHSGLVRFHMSTWDFVYENETEDENIHYHSFTLVLEKRVVTLVTLSDRIAKGISAMMESDCLAAWAASLYPDILRPMTVLFNYACVPDTPIIITRGDRTEPQCDILHLAIEDALLLS